jgi:carbon storage regulator CsrA
LLILGRRNNQSIVFPNCGITVRILDVNGRVAKIGIEAPRSVEIMRGELALASQSSQATAIPTPVKYEQKVAPESEQPVLQLSQRLAEIKAGLHQFQQRRADGDEEGADRVLEELLNEIAVLDADWLRDSTEPSRQSQHARQEFVSESLADYQTTTLVAPIQVLVVHEQSDAIGFSMPAGTFHGCQVCAVNDIKLALQAVFSNDRLDYVVCNASAEAFDGLELVRTMRADRRMDDTKIFMTSDSVKAMERLELSNTYRIDGWLEHPLTPQDLWKHIVKSEQLES